MSEYIYILENLAMPGIVKIGRTERSVATRAGELSAHTGVPVEFTVFGEYAVGNSVEAERTIHERLAEYRVSGGREFFALAAEDAAAIIGEILTTPAQDADRDFEREDDLLARATEIAIKSTTIIWPAMLGSMLKVSYQEAEFLIRTLKGRGVIDDQLELTAPYLPERQRWQREEAEQKRKEAEREEAHLRQRLEVKAILNDLRDPETSEPIDLDFERDGESLRVVIRGSAWVTAEAQKRLASFGNPPQPQEGVAL